MYSLSLFVVTLVVLVPACFGNAVSLLEELQNRINALEKRDTAQSRRIEVLEQQAKTSHTKMTYLTKLSEDLKNAEKLMEQDGIIAELKKELELQQSEADGNRRKIEILELKVLTLSEIVEKTDKLFVQPEKNLDKLETIEATQTEIGENPEASSSNHDHGEVKSRPANQKFAINRINDNETETSEQLLDKMRENSQVYGELKNKYAKSLISKRYPTSPIAFHAVISQNVVRHLGINQNIIFDTADVNYGGGYDKQHGVFTAPQSGLYLFSLSVLSYREDKPEFDAAIVRNGQSLAIAYGHADSARYDQGSVTVVTHLFIGDEISVKNVEISDVSIWGGKYTTFTGVLITDL